MAGEGVVVLNGSISEMIGKIHVNYLIKQM
jgi:hypothetical protein